MHIRNIDQLKNIQMLQEYKEQIKQAFGSRKTKRQKYNNKLIYLSKCCNAHAEILGIEKGEKKFKCYVCHNECKAIFFRSKWESQYFLEALVRIKVGDIDRIERQVPFKYSDNGEERTYYADFVEYKGKDFQVIDTKGKLTKEYLRTKKLFEGQYGIQIIEKYR